MKLYDLSHPITHGMEVFPADPVVDVLPHHKYGNGYLVHQIALGTHTGTHIDVPAHCMPGGATLTDIPIERFIGRETAVIDLTAHPDGEDITARELASFASLLSGCDGAILYTGWERHFGTPEFFERYSGLHEDVAEFLADQGIRILGLDTPSVHPQRHRQVHRTLLDLDIVIAESLANLGEVRGRRGVFCAVPLPLQGLDGSPVRAFFVELKNRNS